MKLIRGYGPYVHPNVLAGGLLIGLSALLCLVLRREHEVYTVLGFWLLLGVAVSFSRAGWAGAGLWFLLCNYLGWRRLVSPRFVRRMWLFALVLLLLFSPLILGRIRDLNDRALLERERGVRFAVALLEEQPWWRGVGLGNYERALQEYVTREGIDRAPWEVAPVHSAPLLVLAEWGVVLGGLLLLLCVWGVGRLLGAGALFLAPLVPGLLLDHYFVTQPVMLVYLLVLVLAAGRLRRERVWRERGW